MKDYQNDKYENFFLHLKASRAVPGRPQSPCPPPPLPAAGRAGAPA